MKIQRNDMCPCGSGRKYKQCCMGKSEQYIEIMCLVKALMNTFDHEQEEIDYSISKINEIIKNTKMQKSEMEDLYPNLIQLYSWGGYDKKVIEIIGLIDLEKLSNWGAIFVLTIEVKSYVNINKILDAYEKVMLLESKIDKLEWGDNNINVIKSGALIELGKFYHIIYGAGLNNGNNLNESVFLKFYDELIEAYDKKKYDDIDHYTGAMANKGSYLLLSSDDKKQMQGFELIKKAYKEKVRVGNWNGIANDFSRLGVFYRKRKQYKQAMAYTKRDYNISCRYGSKRDVITSLINLYKLYRDAYQLSDARYMLKLIEEKAEEINLEELKSYIDEKRNELKEIAINCKRKGTIIGENALCPCESGKKYNECCGVADMDYSAIEKVLGLDQIIPYAEFECENGKSKDKEDIEDRNELKRVLRKFDSSKIRLSWVKLINEGALDYVYELPDMTSIHLNSAKVQLENYREGDLINEVSSALSIVMLSLSALEAFLNQLVFFLAHLPANNEFESAGFKISEQIKKECMAYQRNVGFSQKINEIANIYTFGKWNQTDYVGYDELMKFIRIRNELVHFKSAEYIQIIPPNKIEILEGLPNSIELRDVSNAWPFQLLNYSFAKWGIEVVENSINYIKERYFECEEK